MTQSNNLSPIPFYESIEEQDYRKPWAYGDVPCLAAPKSRLLPFFFKVANGASITGVSVINFNTGQAVSNVLSTSDLAIASMGAKRVVYYNPRVISGLSEGRYYITVTVLVGATSTTYYSDVFNAIADDNGAIPGYLKLEWYDVANLETEDSFVPYAQNYKNVLWLPTDVGMPAYSFDEEATERDGFTFVSKQLSEKTYKFVVAKAPEYMCDAMRIIRLSDVVKITDVVGRDYTCDTFLMDAVWQEQGHYAAINAEFQTNTVIKKISTTSVAPSWYITLAQHSVSVAASYNGQYVIPITTNIPLSNLTAIIQSGNTWLSNARVAFLATGIALIFNIPTNSGAQRTGTISVGYGGASDSVTITQLYNPSISLSPSTYTVAKEGQTGGYLVIDTLTPIANLSASATPGTESWVVGMNITEVEGEKRLYVNFEANTKFQLGFQRESTITVSGNGQSATALVIQSCPDPSITPTSESPVVIENTGGDFAVEFANNGNLDFDVTTLDLEESGGETGPIGITNLRWEGRVLKGHVPASMGNTWIYSNIFGSGEGGGVGIYQVHQNANHTASFETQTAKTISASGGYDSVHFHCGIYIDIVPNRYVYKNGVLQGAVAVTLPSFCTGYSPFIGIWMSGGFTQGYEAVFEAEENTTGQERRGNIEIAFPGEFSSIVFTKEIIQSA